MMLEVFGVQLCFYGLCYAVGFATIFLWMRSRRERLGLTRSDPYDFALLFCVCVLLLGRCFELCVYEWQLYRGQPLKWIEYWNGGMASHGVLLGAALGTLLYSRLRGVSFLRLADEVVIPGALLMALGRIGNFVNAEIYGPVTSGWWGVETPYAAGLRHPVTLYDAAKNIAVAGILLYLERRTRPYPGKKFAHFIFWYAFLRIFVDQFRQYESYVFGIGTGQYCNAAMAAAGALMIVWRRRGARDAAKPTGVSRAPRTVGAWGLAGRRVALSFLIAFALTIPSGWSQEWLAHRRISITNNDKYFKYD
jgi:phosphatidylglycerol---prolipoprotein diacylglyceryl transferase